MIVSSGRTNEFSSRPEHTQSESLHRLHRSSGVRPHKLHFCFSPTTSLSLPLRLVCSIEQGTSEPRGHEVADTNVSRHFTSRLDHRYHTLPLVVQHESPLYRLVKVGGTRDVRKWGCNNLSEFDLDLLSRTERLRVQNGMVSRKHVVDTLPEMTCSTLPLYPPLEKTERRRTTEPLCEFNPLGCSSTFRRRSPSHPPPLFQQRTTV